MGLHPKHIRTAAQPNHTELQALRLLYQRGEHAPVIALARKLLRRSPGNVLLHNVLGAALIQLGKFKEAVFCYRKLIGIDPQCAEAHNNLGVALSRLGYFPDAIRSYGEAIRLEPAYAEAHSNRGHSMQRLGRLNEALLSCQRAVTLRSDLSICHNYLGGVLRELGRPAEAVMSYRRAIQLEPDLPDNLADLGDALREMGKLEDAVACYHEALGRSSTLSDAHYRLGDVLAELGMHAEAAEHYVKVGSREANAKLLGSLFACGRLDDYFKALSEMVRNDATNIRAATISVSISHQLKAENPYKFCVDPLRFVHIRNISEHLNPIRAFDDALATEICDATFVFEPPRKTTRSGYQTSGNLFELSGTRIEMLKHLICDQVAAYLAEYRGSSDVYITKWPKRYKLNGWYVRLQQGGHQDLHIHPDGWLSGVLYLRMPRALKGDQGSIRFTLHGQEQLVRQNDIPDLVYRPHEGDLVLFPSSLLHHTIPYDADEERHSLSFDLQPE